MEHPVFSFIFFPINLSQYCLKTHLHSQIRRKITDTVIRICIVCEKNSMAYMDFPFLIADNSELYLSSDK